ncbi:MAG TPA: AMP-binding protein, partial [Blastocatellia bacterium]|nr:AMP-binding protein [Blastocatellia bacterium]
MNFIDNILHRLTHPPDHPVLREARDGKFGVATRADLLAQIRAARTFIRRSGLNKGDRVGLLAPNSIRWTALDLALTAEGVIVVPLYSRQAPNELVNMLKDCGAAMVCCGDEALRDGLANNWVDDAPPLKLFDEVFATEASTEIADEPIKLEDSDVVTIIYTSGTSGEPKGVMLTAGGVTFMLDRTGMRLDQLMEGATETAPDQIFHYLPCCFAGSWILL